MKTIAVLSLPVIAVATGLAIRYAGARDAPAPVVAPSAPAPRHELGATAAGFRVTYNASPDPMHGKVRELFAADGMFDRVAAALDRIVKMPRTIDVVLADCSQPNAFYDPNGHRIVVCYELVSYFLDTFRPQLDDAQKLGAAAMGATFFAFFHELGHCLIHELGLPATGREEDAADQIATLILLPAGDDGVTMALAGAKWFALLASNDKHRTPFWDEHAFDGQRFYNIVCMIYGADPVGRAGLPAAAGLPEARAKRCPVEYRALDDAWEKLIAPHLR